MKAPNLGEIPLITIKKIREAVASVKRIVSSDSMSKNCGGICIPCVLGSIGGESPDRHKIIDKAKTFLIKLGLARDNGATFIIHDEGFLFASIGDTFKRYRNSEAVMKERRNHVLKKLDLAIKERTKKNGI